MSINITNFHLSMNQSIFNNFHPNHKSSILLTNFFLIKNITETAYATIIQLANDPEDQLQTNYLQTPSSKESLVHFLKLMQNVKQETPMWPQITKLIDTILGTLNSRATITSNDLIDIEKITIARSCLPEIVNPENLLAEAQKLNLKHTSDVIIKYKAFREEMFSIIIAKLEPHTQDVQLASLIGLKEKIVELQLQNDMDKKAHEDFCYKNVKLLQNRPLKEKVDCEQKSYFYLKVISYLSLLRNHIGFNFNEIKRNTKKPIF